MSTKLSDADKIGMSPEEIAALEGENADALLAMHGATEQQQTNAGDSNDDDGGSSDEDDASLSTDQLAEVLNGEQTQPPADPAPLKVETLDYAAERKKLSDERAAIERKWAAGEEGCTDEWRAQELERIEAARDDLLIRHTRAETLREQNEQAAARSKEAYDNAINAEVRRLLEASKKEGAAVAYAADPKAQQQFDLALKMIEADPDAASLTPAQRVADAHRLVLARRGIAAPAPAPAPAPAAARREVPVTLSGLPNAGREVQGNDILAELNTLSGEDYEMKLASLPAAQVERLLRQADNAAAAIV